MTDIQETLLEKEIVDLIVRVNENFGADPGVSRIIGHLYISPLGLSMEDLIKKTGYSAATISNKTQVLVRTGIIQRKHQPGTKKAFFYMDKDMKQLNAEIFKRVLELKVKPLKQELPKIVERHEKSKKIGNKEKEQLKIIKKWEEQIRYMEDCVKEAIIKLEGDE